MNCSPEELEAFLAETDEGLVALDRDFLALERNPRDREALSRAFRVLHTIKGTSSFLDLKTIETLAHAGEHLLARLRDGLLDLEAERATLLLRTVDALRRLSARVRESGDQGDASEDELIESLRAAAEAAPRRETGGVAAQAPAPAKGDSGTGDRSALDRATAAGIAETSIRVDLSRLDRFMNIVGELVLIRNQIVQQVSEGGTPAAETLQRLNGVTSMLQEGVLRVRMQPVGKLWSNLPRVVHDLAASLGKRVELEMEGGETELDRAVIETIRDPLVHAVRNALDHGIELPEARVRAGKRAQARLGLRAWHEGGLVHIAVEDDGAGVDLERVRRKGVARGLLDPARAASATDEELIELIFQPGFSTAEAVTNVSGRGVGMDVVRSALERVGGSITFTTRVGQGTKLLMSMPLTLAIVSALVVRAGGERFAIPRASLEEVVRVEAVESFHGFPMFRLRGALIPLLGLSRALGTQADGEAPPSGIAAIVRGDGRCYGLVVDELLDMQEIVVKRLPKWFRGPRCFAGLTILGDGSVAVILDVAGLGRRARIAVGAVGQKTESARRAPVAARPADSDQVVVVGDGRGGRQAIRLGEVIRIEKMPRSWVEQLDGRPVVNYQGSVLHLIDLAPWAPQRDPVSVIVTQVEGRRVGLVVDQVLDIATGAACEGSTQEGRPVVVVNGHMASLQDPSALLAAPGAPGGARTGQEASA